MYGYMYFEKLSHYSTIQLYIIYIIQLYIQIQYKYIYIYIYIYIYNAIDDPELLCHDSRVSSPCGSLQMAVGNGRWFVFTFDSRKRFLCTQGEKISVLLLKEGVLIKIQYFTYNNNHFCCFFLIQRKRCRSSRTVLLN